MKFKYLILLIFLTVNQLGFSQTYPCDPTTDGVEVRNPANVQILSLPVGANASLRFFLYNGGIDNTCIIPVAKFKVIISFPTNTGGTRPYIYNGPATFTTSLFNWTYNTAANVLIGLNHTAIGEPLADGTGTDLVYVPIKGNAVGVSTTPFNIYALSGISNNPAGDGWLVPLTVVVPDATVPVVISDIAGSSENCTAFAKWTASNEINISKYEVESSTDGSTFASVGSIKAKDALAENVYQFSWKQDAGKVFYRVKIISKDGTASYSKIVPIVINCNTNKFVKIYPNPVILNQVLNVNIEGYNSSIKGDLYTATGQLVKSFILRNGANKLPVENVAQGFYTLRISESGIQTEVFKLNVLK